MRRAVFFLLFAALLLAACAGNRNGSEMTVRTGGSVEVLGGVTGSHSR